MNGPLFRHTWRSQRLRLAVVSLALTIWGFILPIVFAQFGSQFQALMESGMLPEQFAKFGGGDIFSLPGSIALGFIHPIAIILTSVFAVGFSTSAVAGERQRGTLEVALARPISRRVLPDAPGGRVQVRRASPSPRFWRAASPDPSLPASSADAGRERARSSG